MGLSCECGAARTSCFLVVRDRIVLGRLARLFSILRTQLLCRCVNVTNCNLFLHLAIRTGECDQSDVRPIPLCAAVARRLVR